MNTNVLSTQRLQSLSGLVITVMLTGHHTKPGLAYS